MIFIVMCHRSTSFAEWKWRRSHRNVFSTLYQLRSPGWGRSWLITSSRWETNFSNEIQLSILQLSSWICSSTMTPAQTWQTSSATYGLSVAWWLLVSMTSMTPISHFTKSSRAQAAVQTLIRTPSSQLRKLSWLRCLIGRWIESSHWLWPWACWLKV